MSYQRTKPTAIGVKASFPGFIKPALATKIDKVPTGGRWVHEIKFDGYRVQLISVITTLKCSPDAAAIGRSASGRSQPTRI